MVNPSSNPAGNVALGWVYNPDSKVHGANMGSIWGRQDPGEPHVGPMNLAIWEGYVRWNGSFNFA